VLYPRIHEDRIPHLIYRILGSKILEYDVLILIKDPIIGLINNRYRNLLVWNFWQLINGTLMDSDVDMINVAGTGFRASTSTDLSAGGAYVVFGTGTADPSYGDISLKARSTALEGAGITPAIVEEPDKARLRFGRVSAGTVYEVGLYQPLYSGTTTYLTLLGRSVIPNGIPSGQNVYYDVIVMPPFTRNFVNMLFGILTNTDQSGVNLTGTSYTMRSSGEVNASGCILYIGSRTTSPSLGDYSLLDPIPLTSARNYFVSTRASSILLVSGATRLARDYTIGEIGLVQELFDTGGGRQLTLLARVVPASPISRRAGEVFSAILAIYTSAT
jgi:hypothetical protein